MKFCRNCGEHLEAGSVFCAKCGARQEATAVVQPNQSQKKSRIFIILAVVVVIAIVAFFIYSNTGEPDIPDLGPYSWRTTTSPGDPPFPNPPPGGITDIN